VATIVILQVLRLEIAEQWKTYPMMWTASPRCSIRRGEDMCLKRGRLCLTWGRHVGYAGNTVPWAGKTCLLSGEDICF